MKPHPFKTFNAKILLFGEHLINLGSDALSIPYDKFNGALTKGTSSDSRLLSFLDYLRSSQFDFLDTSKLLLREELAFSSNIPEGYGCGSSGAIVAACYDHFRSDQIIDSAILKERFSKMESFYHGKSSGTDPLISYLDSAIKFSGNTGIHLIPNFGISLQDHSLILIDSGRAREGKKQIEWFMAKAEDEQFRAVLTKKLIPATQTCIASVLNTDEAALQNSFSAISNFQLEYMDHMIPDSIKTLWIAGSRSENLHLKICGAGGGGFFIGLMKKNTQLKELDRYKTYPII